MLRLWLPLNGDLHNQGLDDATSTATGTVKWSNTGKIGKGFDINGGYVRYTVPSMVGTNIFSVSFWYKPISNESITANWNKILVFTTKKTDGAEGALFRFESSYNGGTSNTYAISVHNNVGEPIASVDHTLTGEWDKWHHIVAASDGTNMYTYCDNVLIRTSKCNGGTLAGGVYVGYSGTRPNGIMNDVRVYDHCLSTKEIKELSKGLVLHYPLNRGGFGADNLFVRSDRFVGEDNAYVTINARKDNCITAFDGKSIYTSKTFSKGDVITLSAKSNLKWSKVHATSGQNNGTVGFWLQAYDSVEDAMNITNLKRSQFLVNSFEDEREEFKLTWTVPASDNGRAYNFRFNSYSDGTTLVTAKFWDLKLELGDHATPWVPNSADALYSSMGLDDGIEYDVSGYGNNGEWYAYDTNGSIEYTSDTPRYNVSTHIASANPTTNAASGTRYLYGHCSITNPTEMTVAFWCKPIKGYSGGTTQGQFCTTAYEYGNINVGEDYQASAMNHRDGTIDINDSTSTTQCRPNITFVANKWHHYVITYDGQNGRTYRDGVLQNTKSFSEPKILDSFIGVVIGFSKAGGVWRRNDSYYSDFRVYMTCLDDSDILALYNTPTSIASNGTLLTQGEISEV